MSRSLFKVVSRSGVEDTKLITNKQHSLSRQPRNHRVLLIVRWISGNRSAKQT